MGYESKLYIVNKTRYIDPELNLRWAQVIATFDLCQVKCAHQFMQYPHTDVYIYEGEDRIIEDKYEVPLKEIPIEDAIKLIEAEDSCNNYRRFKPVLGLLRGFNPNEWQDLVVLHYGH